MSVVRFYEYMTRVVAILLVSCLIFSDCRELVKDNEISSNDGCEVGGRVYKVGEQWTRPGECNLYTCFKGGAYGGVTCPLVHFHENSGCIQTNMDYTKDYPDCCPQVICPEDKGSNKEK